MKKSELFGIYGYLIVGLLMLNACQEKEPQAENEVVDEVKKELVKPDYPKTGGKDYIMSEIAKELKKQEGKFYWYLSKNRLAGLQAGESSETGLRLIELKATKGDEMIRLGMNEAAIRELESAKSDLDKDYSQDPNYPRYRYIVLKKLGLAYMRLGEQLNCLEQHDKESCIMPIKNGGIHKAKMPARTAAKYYGEMLSINPSDLTARYLFNLAYMAMGEYPHNVPAEYRISDELLKRSKPFPAFVDKAKELGIDINELSGTSILDDFDNDNDLDLMVSSWGFDDQLRYFENVNGRFEERTKTTGLEGLIGGLCMKPADYNNDGYLDILVLRGAWYSDEVGLFPNSLIRNNGDGTFTDVTVEAGIFSKHPTQTGAWGDYNNDGNIDLFIANESTKENIHQNELYTNNGDGTFSDDSEMLGHKTVGYFKGAVWGDIDNDGLIDLFISNLAGDNKLFKNVGRSTGGRWLFQDISEIAGVTEPKESFPTWFFDYNNDGYLDLFVATYPSSTLIHRYSEDFAREMMGEPFLSPTSILYLNQGDGTFKNVTKEANLDVTMFAMGSNYGDLDGDGYLDLYIGNGEPNLESIIPNRVFRNNQGERFEEVSFTSGMAHLQKGHGVSFADIDHDGDQDVYMVMGGAFEGDNYYNVLFENPGFKSDWLVLKLEGTETNKKAIGARIEVKYKSSRGERSIHRVVDSGSSFGNNPLRQEIGLGRNAGSITYVQIFWPGSEEVERITGLSKNKAYRIVEGSGKAERIDY